MAGQSKPRAIERVKVAPGIWKRKRADGYVYEVTYRDSDGRQVRATVEGGRKAAETVLAKAKSDMGQGKRVAPMPKLTFAQAAERWAESAERSVKGTTMDAYRSALNTHLLPAWGKRRLDTLDVDAVATLVERMGTAEYRREVELRIGRKGTTERAYRAWTIRRTLVTASRVFEHAHRRLHWAGVNPVSQLQRGERPRHESRDRRILGRDELAAVIAAADHPHGTIIATAANLGTRLGETLGLRWGDVDLSEGTVTIAVQLGRDGKLVSLKTTRSRRVIEMPGSLVSTLRAHKLASVNSGDDCLVFTSRQNGPMEHRNVAQRGLKRAYKRADLDGRPPTFHELRHSHASAWIASGGDVVELSTRLGHRDPSTTARLYAHDFEAAARSDVRRARLDALYGSDEPSAPERDGLRLVQ